jgi:hypothetical protein
MRHQAESRKRFDERTGIVVAVLVGALLASPAVAKPAGKRIAVLAPGDGTAKDAVIATSIVKVLKQQKIVALSGAPVKKALGKGGAPLSDDDWSVLARKLKVDGVIESTVSQTGAKRKIEVVVRNGADGAVAERATFTAKGPPAKLAAAVAAGFWRKLGAAVKATTPPLKTVSGPRAPATGADASGPAQPSEKPSQEGKKAAPAQPETKPAFEEGAKEVAEAEGDEFEGAPAARKRPAPGGAGRGRPRSLEVEIGGRALQRLFEYTPSSASQAYVEHFLPVLAGRAAWFPITHAGVFVSGEFNSALKSGSNPSYPTGTRELIIGAQGRYPASFGVLGLSVAYFQHLFVLGDDAGTSGAPRNQLAWPDVAYQGARLAASGRFYLGDRFQIGAEAAYRLVTSSGEGGSRVRSSYYFPNGTANYGLDGSAFLGVAVLPWLEIRAGVDYRRYAFGTLVPGPDNARGINASAATDQYLGFSLGAVGVYGGR